MYYNFCLTTGCHPPRPIQSFSMIGRQRYSSPVKWNLTVKSFFFFTDRQDNVKSMTENSQTFLDSIPEQRKLILGSWKLFCNIFPPRNGLLTYLDCIHMDTIRVVYECSFEQKGECGSTGLQVQACLFFSIAFV